MFSPPKPTMRQGVERDPGGLPVLDEGEEIILSVRNITLAFDTLTTQGAGTLAVTSTRICWMKDGETAGGGAVTESGVTAGSVTASGGGCVSYEFDVPYVCLHAVARDPSTYPAPCLYCQLDEEEELREAFFVPAREAIENIDETLQRMFAAFSRAAELNPDAPEPGEQEGDDELIFDESVALSGAQSEALTRFDEMLVVDEGAMGGALAHAESGQFDDAEGGGEEGEEGAEAHANGSR